MGRTGKWWSIQNFPGLEPDLMSVASRWPQAPAQCRYRPARNYGITWGTSHVFTTAGNPVTAAAAMATIDVIEQEHLLDQSRILGEKAKAFFEAEQQKYPFIGDVRMYGLDGGIDIVDPETNAPDPVATTKLIYRVFELGAIIISLRGNVLRFQPPLVITEEQLNKAFVILAQAFSELAAGQLKLPANADQIGW